MKKIYGIFTGEYSDYRIMGYMEDRKSAEKYCALKNLNIYGDYCVEEIGDIEISAETDNVKLKYYHEVVFDFQDGDFKIYKMRKEPTRYHFFTGEDKPTEFKVQTSYTNLSAIHLMSTSRKKAEKTAQDMMAKLAYAYAELGDIEAAMAQVGAKER